MKEIIITQIISSHPAWDAWIEMDYVPIAILLPFGSHPAWDAWIEILVVKDIVLSPFVASRMGCVD